MTSKSISYFQLSGTHRLLAALFAIAMLTACNPGLGSLGGSLGGCLVGCGGTQASLRELKRPGRLPAHAAK